MDERIIGFIISVLLVSWMVVLAFESLHLGEPPVTAAMIFPMSIVLIFMLVAKDEKPAAGSIAVRSMANQK